LANLLFSNELARRTNGTGLTSNAVHPGVVVTDSARHVERELQKDPVMPYVLPFLKSLFNIFAMNADDGALTQLYVATSPKLKGVTGKYYVPIATEGDPAPIAKNLTLQERLWEESEKLISLYLSGGTEQKPKNKKINLEVTR
jgi:NAD(P)-dependent dehydrogenase (short-subunit alcohol dehydrogenase family)